MRLEQATQEYLDWARLEVRMSKNTVAQRKCKLKLFSRFLSQMDMENPTVKQIDLPIFRAFVRYLTDNRGCCSKTVRTYIEALRGVWGYLREYGYIEESPVHRIRLPKPNPPERQLVSTGEIISMFEGCDLIRPVRRSAMAKAVLAVWVYGGLRTRELLDLTIDDLLLDEGMIKIARGKGGKYRKIPLHSEAMPYLRKWMDFRGEANHSYLFAYDRHRRLGKYTVRSLWQEILWMARIDRPIKPHALRHNYATRLLGKGTNLHHIQQLLGHSSITTTIGYLHSDLDQLKEIVELGGNLLQS